MEDYREKVKMMAYRGHRGAHTSAEATGNLWCPCNDNSRIFLSTDYPAPWGPFWKSCPPSFAAGAQSSSYTWISSSVPLNGTLRLPSWNKRICASVSQACPRNSCYLHGDFCEKLPVPISGAETCGNCGMFHGAACKKWLAGKITTIHRGSGWWFQIFVIFTPTWGNDPIWLIFFKWVETTN